MENKDGPGGLLGNVSLLTTGGSSLQNQLTNDDLRLNVNYGQSTLHNISEIPHQNRGRVSMETSTPARPTLNTNVMYGFDLSPVHSYEVPVSTNSGKTTFRSQVEEDKKHGLSLNEDLIEEEQILDQQFDSQKGNAAPNFMQAPLVPSPHQSRIGAISELEENTETMMSHVYASNIVSKAKSGRSKSKEQLSKTKPPKFIAGDSNRSRTPNSPRKTSKHYNNIKSSGYGMVELSTNKSAKKLKKKFTTMGNSNTDKTKKSKSPLPMRKQPLPKEKDSKYPFPTAGPTKESNLNDDKKANIMSNRFGVTHTVQSLEALHDTNENKMNQSNVVIGNRSPEKSLQQSQVKYRDLEEKYTALEAECGKMKLENSQVAKQNFMLSAKLNHFIDDGEKNDDMQKDTQGNDLEPQERENINLKREIIELERLMKGYQTENEKMYQQIAKTKQINQENEMVMYNENLRLKTRIAQFQEEINRNEEIIKDKNQVIKENKLQNRNMKQNEQIVIRDSNCKEHERIIQDLREKLSSSLSHQEGELKRLKVNEEEISVLKAQVHKMKKELLAKNQSKRESELVTDLRRQVRELESISTKYHSKDDVKYLIHGDRDEQKLLEERCEKLEVKLKEQEEESGENIKSLQKLYNNMRVEYETHVSRLSEEVNIMKIQTKKHKNAQDEIKSNFILCESLENENKNLKSEVIKLRNNVQYLSTENKNLSFQLKESKLNKENKSPLTKRKTKSKGNELKQRIYNPDHFDNLRDYRLKQDDPLRISIERKNVKELDSIQEVLKWKKLHEESNHALESLKLKHIEQITSINEANQKTIQILEERLGMAEKKLCESESTKFTIEAEKSTSQAKENALQQQIKYLLDELQETRMGSPDIAVRRIEALQSRVSIMDLRQKAREEKLDKALVKSADSCLREEIESLHAMIAEKDNLLVKFRSELDSMLLTLEILKTNSN